MTAGKKATKKTMVVCGRKFYCWSEPSGAYWGEWRTTPNYGVRDDYVLSLYRGKTYWFAPTSKGYGKGTTPEEALKNAVAKELKLLAASKKKLLKKYRGVDVEELDG